MEAESILNMLKRTRQRRIKDIDEVPNSWHWIDRPWPRMEFGHLILKWVDEYTTGKFYIDNKCIVFEKSEDAFIYELGFGKPDYYDK